LLFIVRTFFNYAFAVVLWTSFHVARLTSSLLRFPQRKGAIGRSGQMLFAVANRRNTSRSITTENRHGRVHIIITATFGSRFSVHTAII
jgi:hypothetical protein